MKPELITISSESATDAPYDNHILTTVNDHVVLISVMTSDYHWHSHTDSDEAFLAIEGGLYIDLEDRTIKLLPGQMFTVMCGVRHRTRPVGIRSVNLTFERSGAQTENLL